MTAAWLGALLPTPALHAAPPEGVIAEAIGSGWQELAGVVELPDGRLIAWERAGKLWMVQADGTRDAAPMLDISDEVLAWRDHGLLGVALDPDFEANGFIYLAYVVDRHHLDFFGTPQYNPATTTTNVATIARLTRFTADPDEDFSHIHPETRHVLLGATREDGVAIVHQSHGVGSLVFGEDGTLMMSVGESADYATFDTGGQMPGGFVDDALAHGILRPEDNIGAYRAQRRDCMNGKLLRLDPATGDGVPSNPFFDPAAPRAPRSRVWAMGLRNPFRVSRIPGTGAHLPSAANPGTFIVSDVGWGFWEEVDLIDAPGLNLGWPVYEGHDRGEGYTAGSPLCIEAPNPLANGGGCEPFFRYRDLIVQETQAQPDWINPCVSNQVESASGSNSPVLTTNGGTHGCCYRNLLDSSGSWFQLFMQFPAGNPTLVLRYANGGESVDCPILIDGVQAGSVTLASTGSWTEWRLAAFPISATQGQHLVRMTGPGSGSPTGAPVVAAIDSIFASADGSFPVIPTALRNGMHRRPLIDWPHGFDGSRTSGWNLGAGVARVIGSPLGAQGVPFKGSCAIATAPIALKNWPAQWQDKLWMADYAEGWIRAATLENGQITRVDLFDQLPGGIVGIFPSAAADAFYAVDFVGGLTRYRYAPTGNRPPVLVVSTSTPYGPAPLGVSFDASATTDPDGDRLEIVWDFGDGTPPEIGRVVEHTFAGTGAPSVRTVQVSVSDGRGLGVVRQLRVWPDNEPPRVRVLSPQDGTLYRLDQETVFSLRAQVDDSGGDLPVTCQWLTTLHHNTHVHPEPPDPACESSMVVSPLGCGQDQFWVTVELVVTDSLGLSASELVRLDPDCAGVLNCRADLNGDGVVGGADIAQLLGWWGSTSALSWQADANGDGQINGADIAPLLAAWGPCPAP